MGGGLGNSQAERLWAVFSYSLSKSQEIFFSPSDTTSRSKFLAKEIFGYSGGNKVAGEGCYVAPNGEASQAPTNNWSPWSYQLNSIWTHKSCRYAKIDVLPGFATESAIGGLDDPNGIKVSTRNSEGFSDPGSDFDYPLQDVYDSGPAGAAAPVRTRVESNTTVTTVAGTTSTQTPT